MRLLSADTVYHQEAPFGSGNGESYQKLIIFQDANVAQCVNV